MNADALGVADLPFVAQVILEDPDIITTGPISRETLAALEDLGLGPDPRKLAEMFLASATNEDTLTALAGVANCPDVLVAIARNPHAPLELVLELATNTSWRVRNAACSRADFPLHERGRVVYKSTDQATRVAAAVHASTPADGLAHLATDPDSAVRAAVAGNPHAPLASLTALAADHELGVRNTLATNSALIPELAEAIARPLLRNRGAACRDFLERWPLRELARNPHTPPQLLDRLAAPASSGYTCVPTHRCRHRHFTTSQPRGGR